MSEQLVIILLIALTLTIVLIALAIPDESTAVAEPLDTETAAVAPPENVVSAVSLGHERQPIDRTLIDEQGDDPSDARRAADIPEEAGR